MNFALMKHEAKALIRPAVMTLLALALPLTLALAAAAQDPTVDVDGVWGISEEGTDKQGANCDRWASGWGNSPSAISDTDPSIQNRVRNDVNQIRYGAEDTDAAQCHSFADQSGFGFEGERGISMPTDGTPFMLGTFTHYNTTTNIDLADYNPLENVELTMTLSGSVDAVLKCTITLDETANDDVPCMFPDAPNDPPCGERVTFASQSQQGSVISIQGRQYTLEILGFSDGDAPRTPSKILYTREMATDYASMYARLVALPTGP